MTIAAKQTRRAIVSLDGGPPIFGPLRQPVARTHRRGRLANFVSQHGLDCRGMPNPGQPGPAGKPSAPNPPRRTHSKRQPGRSPNRLEPISPNLEHGRRRYRRCCPPCPTPQAGPASLAFKPVTETDKDQCAGRWWQGASVYSIQSEGLRRTIITTHVLVLCRHFGQRSMGSGRAGAG